LSQIEYQQRLLLPFVELGGRSKTFMKALTVINEAKGPKDWCFYFADQYSYADNNAIQRTEDTKRGGKSGKGGVVIETTDSARDGRRALSNTGGVDMFSTMLLPQQEQKIDIKDEHKVVLDTMPLLTYLIMAGYTPVENNKRYAGVLRLQDNLRPSSGKKEKGNTSTEAANAPKKIDTIFTDQVDTMEVDWQGNGINLETGWNLYLKSQKAQFGEFTEFKLILPLAKKQVDIPPPKEPPKKPKKK